jgi:hypothetical protein
MTTELLSNNLQGLAVLAGVWILLLTPTLAWGCRIPWPKALAMVTGTIAFIPLLWGACALILGAFGGR